MNSLIVLSSLLAYASAGLIAGPSLEILQHPSTRTTIIGPSSSSISIDSPKHLITGELISQAPLLHSSLLTTDLSSTKTVVAGPSGTISTSEPALGGNLGIASTLVGSSIRGIPALGHETILINDLSGGSIVAAPSGTIGVSRIIGSSLL